MYKNEYVPPFRGAGGQKREGAKKRGIGVVGEIKENPV
jgi:hypothetical protein